MLIMYTPQGLIDLDADPATWGAPNWLAICRALGRINRWCGNTRRAYPVAEHRLRVAAIVPPDLRLAALIHDAAEAFIGDIPAPLRRAGVSGRFENYDRKISYWLYESAGIRDQLTAGEVWHADRVLAATEYRDLVGGPPVDGWADPLEAVIPDAVLVKQDPGDQLAAEIFKRLK